MTVSFQVSKADFAKKLYYEKLCHIISIGYPLLTAIAGIFLDAYGYDMHRCWISKFDHPKYFLIFKGWITPSVLFWIAFCNARIVYELRQSEKQAKKYTQNLDHLRRGNGNQASRKMAVTIRRGEAGKQALLYTLSYLITYVFVWIRFLMKPPNNDPFLEPIVILILIRIFFPLQGFWNLVVYARPEIRRIKKLNKEFSFGKALHIMIFAPGSLPRRRNSVADGQQARASARSSALAAKMKASLKISKMHIDPGSSPSIINNNVERINARTNASSVENTNATALRLNSSLPKTIARLSMKREMKKNIDAAIREILREEMIRAAESDAVDTGSASSINSPLNIKMSQKDQTSIVVVDLSEGLPVSDTEAQNSKSETEGFESDISNDSENDDDSDCWSYDCPSATERNGLDLDCELNDVEEAC